MSKTDTRQPTPGTRTPADYPSYLREQVVEVLGDAPDLKQSIYIRRRHVLDAYGITRYQFAQMVGSGLIKEKHFVFK